MDHPPMTPCSEPPTRARLLAPQAGIGRSGAPRRIGLTGGVVVLILTVAGFGLPATAQAPPAPTPLVEVVWTVDYLPHGDPVVALELVVEQATACALPPGTGSLDRDPGRGLAVSLDDTEIYRTGADNIVIDDAYALDPGMEPGTWANRSLVEYYAADAFLFYSAWPFDDEGSVTLGVSCQADDGSWQEVISQPITQPDFEQIFPFISGWQIDPDDGLVHLAFADVSYTVAVEDQPTPDDLSVAIDGRPTAVSLLDDPEYGLIDGAFTVVPPADLTPGRHQMEVAWNGRSQLYPLVVDDLDSLAAEEPSEPAEAATDPDAGPDEGMVLSFGEDDDPLGDTRELANSEATEIDEAVPLSSRTAVRAALASSLLLALGAASLLVRRRVRSPAGGSATT